MKRDMDLIRDILKNIEANRVGGEFLLLNYDHFPNHTPANVYGHLELMTDSGLLKAHSQSFDGLPTTNGLTKDGHDFLESVRDPEIWRKTKAAGEKVSGWTVGLLAEYAKGLIKIQFDRMLSGEAS